MIGTSSGSAAAGARSIPPTAPSQLAELETQGGPPLVVVLGIITFLAATVLAVLVTYRFVEGYRRTGSRPILLLAVGMFFFAPAPMFVRLLIANVAAVPLEVRVFVASLSELAGLSVILYVIYTR